ncbi:MAG: PilX N-terminal domain-containing pilus assembly protein [Colwellia sp.]
MNNVSKMKRERSMMTLSNKAHQKGVVLVVSLVFLVALTAVAAALMQNSTVDMKMSGASEEKSVAYQEVISAVDEAIYNQIGPGKSNRFARPVSDNNFPIPNANLLPDTDTQATATADVVNNQYGLDITCPHSMLASSTEVFTCNILRVNTVRNYGRSGQSVVSANAGIAQQLLK